MSGFTRTSRSISTRWLSSGISASFRSNCSSVAICGREKPGGLAKPTPCTVSVGCSDRPRRMRPWSVRSRPVACFTAAMIRGFRLSGSKLSGEDGAADDDERDQTRQRPQADAHQARECPLVALPSRPGPPSVSAVAAGRAAGGVKTQRAERLPSCGAAGPPPPAMFRRRDGADEARGRAGEVRLRARRPWRRRRCSGRVGRISRRPGSARRSPRSGREAGGCARSAATVPARPASARHDRACGSR